MPDRTKAESDNNSHVEDSKPRRLILLTNISDDSVAAARQATDGFVAAQADVVDALQDVFFAHHAIGELIPQTLENLFSGHQFPYHAAEQELGTSFQLAKDAFYAHAFAALRSVLELDLLGVYFAVEDRAHEDVQAWLHSRKRLDP